MTKKIPLILTVALLGLLTASAVWFLQRGSSRTMLGGVYMGQTEPAMDMGVLPGERDMYVEKMSPLTTSIAPMPPYGYPYDDALNVADRSITKNSYHSVVVQDVSGYMSQMREYVKSVGGTVLSYNQGTNENDYEYASITAKVPQNHFEAANAKIVENVKKIINASIDEQDITGQVVSVEEQLQKLNDQKAVKEAELDEATTAAERKRIQLEIDRIQKQIDQVTESQGVVEDRVDYASISITASNREYYFTGNGPRPLDDVVREAWYSLRSTGFGLVYFLIWVAVYAIIWIPVLLLARWIWVKIKPVERKTTSK